MKPEAFHERCKKLNKGKTNKQRETRRRCPCSYGDPCPVCKGTKELDVLILQCPACLGRRQTDVCSCRPSVETLPTKQCPHCNGTGAIDVHTCHVCEGLGVEHDEELYYCEGGMGYEFKTIAVVVSENGHTTYDGFVFIPGQPRVPRTRQRLELSEKPENGKVCRQAPCGECRLYAAHREGCSLMPPPPAIWDLPDLPELPEIDVEVEAEGDEP